MAEPSTTYEPRQPRDTLYQIVLDHFETFRAPASSLRDGEWLPRFVEQEFRDFLPCGWLAGGLARLRCGACGLDRLVPFSCKGRGFCPSCGGRRMADRAAHLVDHVFPDVPVRQWVLSVPHRLRYQLRSRGSSASSTAADSGMTTSRRPRIRRGSTPVPDFETPAEVRAKLEKRATVAKLRRQIEVIRLVASAIRTRK